MPPADSEPSDPPPIPLAPLPKEDPWARLQAMVLDSVTSPHSRRAYANALEAFRQWSEASTPAAFTKATVQRYRAALEERGLAAASINVQLSAIRKLAAEASDNGFLAPEIAAAIGRVKGAKRHGTRTGNWLTQTQAEQMIGLPDRARNKGKRDRALLCLLIGCGLRREELALLSIDRIQQREARWALVDIVGKGKRVRTVPMPSWTKVAIDEWTAAAGITVGRLLRPVNRGDRIAGETMAAHSIFELIELYGKRIGVAVAPHDLRRTFAKLAHKGHAPIEQIQISLGHASIQTTERYLGVQQNLTDAPCDHLGLRV